MLPLLLSLLLLLLLCLLQEHLPVSLSRCQTSVPKANQVAVVADGEWFHLKKNSSGVWEGTASLDKHRNKGVKVTLNACLGDDDTKFATLLEYVV